MSGRVSRSKLKSWNMNKLGVSGDETGKVASSLVRKNPALHVRLETLFFEWKEFWKYENIRVLESSFWWSQEKWWKQKTVSKEKLLPIFQARNKEDLK